MTHLMRPAQKSGVLDLEKASFIELFRATPLERIEIDHTPASDPVRTFATEGTGAVKVHGELTRPTGERLEFVLRCDEGPLFTAVDAAGLRMFVLP